LVEICTATNPLPASALTASNSCLLFANLTFPSVSPSPARVTTRVGARRVSALPRARARVAAVVVFTFKTPLRTHQNRVERAITHRQSVAHHTPLVSTDRCLRRHVVVTRASSLPHDTIARARVPVHRPSPILVPIRRVASRRSFVRSIARVWSFTTVTVASSRVARTSSSASSSVVVVYVCRVGSARGAWRIGFRMSEFLCSLCSVRVCVVVLRKYKLYPRYPPRRLVVSIIVSSTPRGVSWVDRS